MFNPIRNAQQYSRVKGLEVLEVLPERLEEQPELPELEEVRTVLVVPGGLVLGGAFTYDVHIESGVTGSPKKQMKVTEVA